MYFQASYCTLMLGNPDPWHHFMYMVSANLMIEKARCFGKHFGSCQDVPCL